MAQTYMTRQKKPAAVSAAEKTAAPPAVDTAGAEMVQRSLDAIQNVEPHAGRRLNLDAEMAERMQQQFGIRMDQVELRESSQAADMDARAFAKGNVVQFAPGQFQPDTEQGRHLIEHELSHVAQQARGGIHADVPGLNVNADEGLEHQADMGNLTAGAGAPVSVSGLNAEAAPVQGAFDRIKNWFNKVKRSRKAGKALDTRDQAVKEMTAQHNAEQAEITAVMKKQGYTDEEIQAQLMFQRVNQNLGRLERYQDALAAIRDSDVESPEEMDNFHARSARGALRKKSREKRAQREVNFRDNVLAGDQEYSQAEQMADSLIARRKDEAERLRRANGIMSIDAAVKDDTDWKNQQYQAAMKRYNAKQQDPSKKYQGSSGDVRLQRFLQRHMTGTDAENDALFQAVVEQGDQAMMPKLREDADKLMNLDFGVLGTGEDGVTASADSLLANPQQAVDFMTLNYDFHNFSDLLKEGRVTAESLGYSDEKFAEFLQRKQKFGQQSLTARHPMVEAKRTISEADPIAVALAGNQGAFTGLENGRTRAAQRSETAPEKWSFKKKLKRFGG